LPQPSAELVQYYRRLDDLISLQLDEFRTMPFAKADDAGPRIRQMSPENSLLAMGLVPMNHGKIAEIFNTIVELLLASSPENELALQLHRHIAAGAFGLERWQVSQDNLEEDFSKWGEEAGIDVDSLLQLVHLAMSPFLRLAAEQYATELKEMSTNEHSTCPVCGKHPDFAVLDGREHGRRYLVCVSCHLRWHYRRLGCAYCGNNDHDKLGYLLIDGMDGYKIYCCENCKSYLKTFDQRVTEVKFEGNLLLENVKTLSLDLLAIDKGYLPMHGKN
jgi:FdhE protein